MPAALCADQQADGERKAKVLEQGERGDGVILNPSAERGQGFCQYDNGISRGMLNEQNRRTCCDGLILHLEHRGEGRGKMRPDERHGGKSARPSGASRPTRPTG